MPRKKIAAPEPNEQEFMEQAMDAMEGAAAEETDHDGTPSEETLAQMEREYLASSADGAVPPGTAPMLPLMITSVTATTLPPTRICLAAVSRPMMSRQPLNLMDPPQKRSHKALCLLMLTPEGENLPQAVQWAKRMRCPVTMPPS